MTNVENDDDRPPTIDEELRVWPRNLHAEVEIAEAQARETRERQRRAASRRRAFVAAGAILCAVAVGLVIWARRPVPTPEALRSAPEVVQVPRPSEPSKLADIQMTVGEPDNQDAYRRTEGTIRSDNEDVLKLVKFEFYASKFIQNNTALMNQPRLRGIFEALRDELKDAWVVVFAAASIEGLEDYNLELCRRRIYAVRSLIEGAAPGAAKSYSGIVGGEFHVDMPHLPRRQWEGEEERIAKRAGEAWLSQQRKLIVITIRALRPISEDVQPKVPEIVARYARQQDLLPADYDSNSLPFPLGAEPTAPQPVRAPARSR